MSGPKPPKPPPEVQKEAAKKAVDEALKVAQLGHVEADRRSTQIVDPWNSKTGELTPEGKVAQEILPELRKHSGKFRAVSTIPGWLLRIMVPIGLALFGLITYKILRAQRDAKNLDEGAVVTFQAPQASQIEISKEDGGTPSRKAVLDAYITKNYAQALKLALELEEKGKVNADVAFVAADSARKLGDITGAAQRFAAFVATYGGDSRIDEAQWYLADLELLQGQPEEARRHLEKVARGKSNLAAGAQQKLQQLR